MKFIAVAVLGMMLVPLAHAGEFRFTYAREELVAPDELFDRLNESVKVYCNESYDLRSLNLRQLCRQNLVQITIDEIGHPTLTAYAETRQEGRSS